jgi:hypothetical protein
VENLVEKHHFEEVQKNNPLKINELLVKVGCPTCIETIIIKY